MCCIHATVEYLSLLDISLLIRSCLWMNCRLIFSVVYPCPTILATKMCVCNTQIAGMTLLSFSFSALLISSTSCLGKLRSHDKYDIQYSSSPRPCVHHRRKRADPECLCCSCHRSVWAPEQNAAPWRYWLMHQTAVARRQLFRGSEWTNRIVGRVSRHWYELDVL